MALPPKRILLGALAVFFIGLTLLLLMAGLKLTFDHREAWIGFLGLCLLLELTYVAVHFSLKAFFFTRPDVVTRATRVVAAIVALPVTLVFFLLVLFVGAAMIGTGEETFEYVVDFAFIVALLGVPAFFLWRHVLHTFKRAEQIVGRERRPKTVTSDG